VIHCSKNHDWCKKNGKFIEIIENENNNNLCNFYNNNNLILVTGCAGFIGSHTCDFLLKRGEFIIGIDNMNNYYDIELKKKNLDILYNYNNFYFRHDDIRTTTIISEFKPKKIIHLAAMAGVRYSLQNPILYQDVNIGGFINIMEESKKNNVELVVYASSSSVYGLNTKVPFSESDPIEKCNSPYACSKICKEIFGKTYYQLYGIKNIGLRFFTVYGPRGRPDMAPYMFLNGIKNGDKIKKFGDGTSSRDYTYIDDIVSGIIAALDNKNNIECDVFNLGNSSPVSLNEFIETCENITGNKANIEFLPEQLGDVPNTYADITKAKKLLDYNPITTLKEGLMKYYKSMF
jgi:UDP-glucuronate 4-epimerase